MTTIDLGKPTPDADGLIRMDFSGRIGVWPAPALTYEARVVAFGAGGYTTSDASNTFIFGTSPPSSGTSTPTSPTPSSCTYEVWPPLRALSWIEATSTFSVTAGSGCSWVPVASDSWLTPTDLRSRSGDGTITFRATENTAAMSRVGTISTIAGQPVAIIQSATTSADAPTGLRVVVIR